MVGSGLLAAMGVWCLLFGGEGGGGRGRDGGRAGGHGREQGEESGHDGGNEGKRWEKSRVSGWPFRNAEATRVKLENREEKRRLKEEEQRRRGRGKGDEIGTEIEMEDMGWKKGA